jgi:hypothetical protein
VPELDHVAALDELNAHAATGVIPTCRGRFKGLIREVEVDLEIRRSRRLLKRQPRARAADAEISLVATTVGGQPAEASSACRSV